MTVTVSAFWGACDPNYNVFGDLTVVDFYIYSNSFNTCNCFYSQYSLSLWIKLFEVTLCIN